MGHLTADHCHVIIVATSVFLQVLYFTLLVMSNAISFTPDPKKACAFLVFQTLHVPFCHL